MEPITVILKGQENTPVYTSSRVIFTLVIFGGVLLFQNFSASYTSFLAVTTEYKPFDSLQDLLENTDYLIGTPKGYATKEMFQVLKN